MFYKYKSIPQTNKIRAYDLKTLLVKTLYAYFLYAFHLFNKAISCQILPLSIYLPHPKSHSFESRNACSDVAPFHLGLQFGSFLVASLAPENFVVSVVGGFAGMGCVALYGAKAGMRKGAKGLGVGFP